jgi:predicted ATP-dependent Lon-type protease
MSDGKKAAYEEAANEVFNLRCKKLEELGYEKIVSFIDEISNEVRFLEKDLGVLPRSGWMTIDRIKDLLKKVDI